MRFWIRSLLGVGIVVGIAGWIATRPAPLADGFAAARPADAENGALVFAAGGCMSCHSAPGTEGEAALVLAGGLAFPSEFGTFYAPNISPDPQAGIGGWSEADFARALTQGVSPQGKHYYPAFPYAAYTHVTAEDAADLHAYINTLPASATASKPHDVGFPFSIRRGLGLWKLAFTDSDFVVQGALTEVETRGRYLAEALAHCGECHTPRNALGGLRRDAWLAGAPNPSGKGRIPNITPAELDWSDADLMGYLTTGLTPDYDSAGGEMAEVIENLSKLPDADRSAIVAYLRRVPPVP